MKVYVVMEAPKDAEAEASIVRIYHSHSEANKHTKTLTEGDHKRENYFWVEDWLVR